MNPANAEELTRKKTEDEFCEAVIDILEVWWTDDYRLVDVRNIMAAVTDYVECSLLEYGKVTIPDVGTLTADGVFELDKNLKNVLRKKEGSR